MTFEEYVKSMPTGSARDELRLVWDAATAQEYGRAMFWLNRARRYGGIGETAAKYIRYVEEHEEADE